MFKKVYEKIKVNGAAGSYQLSPREFSYFKANTEVNTIFVGNKFKTFFSPYIKETDVDLSTGEIIVKYMAYDLIAYYIKKVEVKKVLDFIMLFKKHQYTEYNLKCIIERTEKGNSSSFNIKHLLIYYFEESSINYKKFVIELIKGSIENNNFVTLLNNLYEEGVLNDKQLIEIIKNFKIDWNEVVFIQKKERIPFLHFLYKNCHGSFFKIFFEECGERYDKINEKGETLEQFILNNKKTSTPMIYDLLYSFKDVVSVINNETKENESEDTVIESKEINKKGELIEEIEIKNIIEKRNSILFITNKKFINISLNESFEIYNEGKYVIVKNNIGKYKFLIKEKERIENILLNKMGKIELN